MVYGTSAIKRKRRTKSELRALDDELVEIVAEIEPATVRQVFYQAVVAGLVPKDEAKGYRVVQRRLVELRETGRIPYGWITDGSRTVYGHTRYTDATQYAASVAGQYRRDYWAESDENVEIWVEKDALAGVLSPLVLQEFGLNLYVTKGFASVTYLQSAADDINDDARPTYIYLLTDFDPSGLSIADTVERELTERTYGNVKVERLAVTPYQIAEYDLPTRPTKTIDKRAKDFIEEYGTGSVELDALPPDALRTLVRDAIELHMDGEQLEVLKLVEHQERELLASVWTDN